MVFLVDVMVLPINRTENEKNKVGKKSNYYNFSISSFVSPVSFTISLIGSPYFFILAANFYGFGFSFCARIYYFHNFLGFHRYYFWLQRVANFDGYT